MLLFAGDNDASDDDNKGEEKVRWCGEELKVVVVAAAAGGGDRPYMEEGEAADDDDGNGEPTPPPPTPFTAWRSRGELPLLAPLLPLAFLLWA